MHRTFACELAMMGLTAEASPRRRAQPSQRPGIVRDRCTGVVLLERKARIVEAVSATPPTTSRSEIFKLDEVRAGRAW